MSLHTARIVWSRGEVPFVDQQYARAHVWQFDGGVSVAASSSPHVVPVPMSSAAAVDPEEAFVASISSCHMLWFLSVAAKRRFVVDRYEDAAQGLMAKNGSGKLAITEVTLHPVVQFSGDRQPTQIDVQDMHALAHNECYIANSINTVVRVIPG